MNTKPTQPQNQVLSENVEKQNRFLRFVLPATIDFTITQLDIEKFYSYDVYKKDIQAGLTEKEIHKKLENMIEDVALVKIHEIDQKVSDTDIQLQKVPTIHNAQFYRFSFGMMLKDYREFYDDQMQEEINQSLT